MKLYLGVLFFLISIHFSAQTNRNTTHNTAAAMTPVAGAVQDNNNGATTKFYNPPRDILGSYYLFDEWDNLTLIYTIDNKRFKIKNMNVNVKENAFESKISKDSVFTFDKQNIEKIVISGREFKLFDLNNTNKIYEIIFKSKNFSIIKGFDFKFIEGSSNPMINRKSDRYVVKSKYYLKTDNQIEKIKLRKKDLLKLFADKVNKEKFEIYMKSNKLSYKNELDVRIGLNYVLK